MHALRNQKRSKTAKTRICAKTNRRRKQLPFTFNIQHFNFSAVGIDTKQYLQFDEEKRNLALTSVTQITSIFARIRRVSHESTNAKCLPSDER